MFSAGCSPIFYCARLHAVTLGDGTDFSVPLSCPIRERSSTYVHRDIGPTDSTPPKDLTSSRTSLHLKLPLDFYASSPWLRGQLWHQAPVQAQTRRFSSQRRESECERTSDKQATLLFLYGNAEIRNADGQGTSKLCFFRDRVRVLSLSVFLLT